MQRFFSKAAWTKVTDMIAKLEKNPKWKCGVCYKDLSSSTSIVCECYLTWYHLKCIGLTGAPKRAVWFCRYCYGTHATVEQNEGKGKLSSRLKHIAVHNVHAGSYVE